MPQEIFDLESAIVKDEIEPLFSYKFGSLKLDIYPSSALEGKYSFAYVESQLYSSAIATEYNELREYSEKILKDNEGKGLSRNSAYEYAETLQQINEKLIELDNWTLKYVAAMSKKSPEELTALIEPEIEKYNRDNNKSLTFSKLINALVKKVNEALVSITVKTEEEEEAELYDTPERSDLVGKLPESAQSDSTENTANGSLSVVSSFTNTSEQLETRF